jgi:hypothetical protein
MVSLLPLLVQRYAYIARANFKLQVSDFKFQGTADTQNTSSKVFNLKPANLKFETLQLFAFPSLSLGLHETQPPSCLQGKKSAAPVPFPRE